MSLVQLHSWNDPPKRLIETLKALQDRNEDKLLELLEVFMRLKSRRKALISQKTLINHRLAVRDFLAWAWPPGASGSLIEIRKATSDDIDRYVADLQAHGGHLANDRVPLQPGTVAAYVAGVRAFYRALEWAGAAKVSNDIQAPRDPTPADERRPALPLPLYKKLLEHLNGHESAAIRDRLAIRLMAEAGLRISEVIGLTTEDFLMGERLLLVRRGKGGKKRSVPLPKTVIADLEAWLRIRTGLAAPGETRVLINMGGKKADGKGMSASMLRKTLAKHYSALGFPARYYGAHMLRHTAGTRFYKASRDLHATARLLGHSNVNTSAIYAKMDLEGLFDVVDKLDSESE